MRLSRIYSIIFLMEKLWNMSTRLWTGTMVAGSRVYGFHIILPVQSRMDAQD
jgi:hypothetical protein